MFQKARKWNHWFLRKNTTWATLVNIVYANCENTTKLLYSAPKSKLREKEIWLFFLKFCFFAQMNLDVSNYLVSKFMHFILCFFPTTTAVQCSISIYKHFSILVPKWGQKWHNWVRQLEFVHLKNLRNF